MTKKDDTAAKELPAFEPQENICERYGLYDDALFPKKLVPVPIKSFHEATMKIIKEIYRLSSVPSRYKEK